MEDRMEGLEIHEDISVNGKNVYLIARMWK